MLNRSVEEILALMLALIPAFTVHEFAHAWVANRLGDSTAKDLGRLTLNPLKHLDVLGTLMVLVAGFGWAKPVPVNPNNLRHGRKDLALVAVVGPLSNLLMAVAVAALWQLSGGSGSDLIQYFLLVFVALNVSLLFFNLLPVSPLDGFKVALGWLPEALAGRFARTAQIGPLVLLGLIILGSLAPQLDILGKYIYGATRFVLMALVQ